MARRRQPVTIRSIWRTAFTVAAGADQRGVGPAVDALQHRIIAAVEKLLHQPGHRGEVLRGGEDIACARRARPRAPWLGAASRRTLTSVSPAAPRAAASAICLVPPVREWNTIRSVFIGVGSWNRMLLADRSPPASSCCKAAGRSAPITSASTRRCTSTASSRTGCAASRSGRSTPRSSPATRRRTASRGWRRCGRRSPGRAAAAFRQRRGAGLRNTLSNAQALTFGQPGFFTPRPINPFFSPSGTPATESFYDTAPLRQTLLDHADFARINREGTRLSVGVTDVELGELAFFDSATTPGGLGPEHVIASGSLPPGFAATRSAGGSTGTAPASPTRRWKRCSTTPRRATRSRS